MYYLPTFPLHGMYETNNGQFQVLQHLSMATERNAMFYGRHEILKDMCDYLLDKKQDILVLYGQSGCGKTSIMAQTAKLVGWFHMSHLYIPIGNVKELF